MKPLCLRTLCQIPLLPYNSIDFVVNRIIPCKERDFSKGEWTSCQWVSVNILVTDPIHWSIYLLDIKPSQCKDSSRLLWITDAKWKYSDCFLSLSKNEWSTLTLKILARLLLGPIPISPFAISLWLKKLIPESYKSSFNSSVWLPMHTGATYSLVFLQGSRKSLIVESNELFV